jgi:CIC family chloride channel protein
VERALAGDLLVRTVVLLAMLKIVATAVCYASGNAGGIFGPSLFIGAMMGASVGSVAHLLFPESTAGPGAYALVGMGTAFAGIVRTPLTSVIMIFEVTRDYTIIVPLMISNLIAFFISQRLQREPIYEALARQDGVHLPTGEHQASRARLRVAVAMRPADETLPPQTTVAEALSQRAASRLDAWPVLDGQQLQGMVERRELARALETGRGDQTLARFLGERPAPQRPDALPHVHPDHGLTLALERMGALRRTVLPVVSRSDSRRLLGVVTLEDGLEAYGVEPAHAPAVEHD